MPRYLVDGKSATKEQYDKHVATEAEKRQKPKVSDSKPATAKESK